MNDTEAVNNTSSIKCSFKYGTKIGLKPLGLPLRLHYFSILNSIKKQYTTGSGILLASRLIRMDFVLKKIALLLHNQFGQTSTRYKKFNKNLFFYGRT